MEKIINHIVMFIAVIMMIACSPVKQIPVQTIVNYRDSLVINKIDSVVVIPIERVIDIVPIYDTLTLETSLSKSISYVDTSLHILRGSIINKKNIEYKYIYRDKIQVKDSVVTKEVPVPVEVVKTVHPKYEKWLWLILISIFMYIGVKIYMKQKL